MNVNKQRLDPDAANSQEKFIEIKQSTVSQIEFMNGSCSVMWISTKRMEMCGRITVQLRLIMRRHVSPVYKREQYA